jgi:hypothetical protein
MAARLAANTTATAADVLVPSRAIFAPRLGKRRTFWTTEFPAAPQMGDWEPVIGAAVAVGASAMARTNAMPALQRILLMIHLLLGGNCMSQAEERPVTRNASKADLRRFSMQSMSAKENKADASFSVGLCVYAQFVQAYSAADRPPPSLSSCFSEERLGIATVL